MNARNVRFAAAALTAVLLVPALSRAATPPASSEALVSAEADTRKDLDATLQELAALRESIRAERIPMTQELGRLEAELAQLRRDQDDRARAQDMRGLEINNLSGALVLRRDEAAYVSNLMDEFARGFGSALHVSEAPQFAALLQLAIAAKQDGGLTEAQKLERQFEVLRRAVGRAEELVGGARYDGEAVDPAGTVHKGSFTMVGPVVLFGEAGGANPGLALPQTGSELAAVRPIEAGFSAGLTALLSLGTGTLPLDPTRGGALQELVKRGSLVHYFHRGGPIMWPLLFVSILALTVILERLVFLAREGRRRDAEAVEGIMARVEAGDVHGALRVGDGSKDFVARTLTYAIRHREKSLTNGLMRASGLELIRFTRGISILDTCVTMAPLLGLLGTVTGMMGSFGMLGGAELSAPAQITGGIAEALIATAFGLGIAVTALIPMNYLHSRADAARHEMEDAATHLELLMKPIMDAEATVTRERMVLKLSREAATA
jgi:biopolymer transport protein ExbB